MSTVASMKAVYRYVTLVCLAGALLLALVFVRTPSWDIFSSLYFWAFAASVLAAELVPIKLPGRREAVTFTVSGPFTFALLLTLGFPAAVLAIAIASTVDDVLRRKVYWKILFNVSQYAISLGAASVVLFTLTELPSPQDTQFVATDLPGILAAAMTFFAVNVAVVGTGVALAEGVPVLQSLRENLWVQATHQPALLALAPVVVATANYSLWLTPFLLIPMVVVYRSMAMAVRHFDLAETLRSLHGATRMSHATATLNDFVKALLENTCEMFKAEMAMVTMFPTEIDPSYRRSTYRQGGEFTFNDAATMNPTRGVWARAASEDKAILVSSPIENESLRTYYESMNVKDAMVAPLRAEGKIVGVMHVCNREGSATFNEASLRLFEMLANHASVSIQNAYLVSQLEESLVHLTEMNQLKDDFVASVSHELRTPLTSIQGYVKTLLRKDADFKPEDVRSFLETIDRQSHRLHRLIEDLLSVSRIESEGAEVAVEDISIERLITDIRDELRSRLEDRTLDVRIEPDLPPVETDTGKVHQVVANLIDNAIKYSASGSSITVEARREGSGTLISVNDEGIGIPAEQQDRIFERFYQVDQSSTRRVGGAGLGLYICRRLAEAIGGRLWLERSGADGSVFCLWLPDTPPTMSNLTDLDKEIARLTNLS